MIIVEVKGLWVIWFILSTAQVNPDGGKEDSPATQTNPPTIPASELYNNCPPKEGEIMHYKLSADDQVKGKTPRDELKANDMVNEEMWNEYRTAAQAHRDTRQYMREWIKPGMSMIQIVEELGTTLFVDNNGSC